MVPGALGRLARPPRTGTDSRGRSRGVNPNHPSSNASEPGGALSSQGAAFLTLSREQLFTGGSPVDSTLPENPYVTRPSVYLVGKQSVVDEELHRFLGDEGMVFATDTPVPAEILAEVAGRTCYMSFGKGRKKNLEYLDNIISSKHGSVLEHGVWSLLITGVSRSLTHELVRHRAGFGYSQLSQRYVDETTARYVVPPLYQEDDELRRKWTETIECVRRAYRELAEMSTGYVREKHPHMSPRDRRKLARQAARSVLPNACETKIFVTGNARSWRHFLELRGSVHADTEIRLLAVESLQGPQKGQPQHLL